MLLLFSGLLMFPEFLRSMVIRSVTTFIFSIAFFTSLAQHSMRPVESLIYRQENSWPLVQGWIDKATNKVEILPCDSVEAKDALFRTQVTNKSPMGAVIYSTGGILVDGGWIRILGSGHPRLNRSLPEWNRGKAFKEFGEAPYFLLVADDAAGGFFAINGGLFGKDLGKLYYLSPDNPEWEALGLSYTEFLNFCFNGDLADFYKDLRWNQWKEDVGKLNGNMAYSFFPYLFTKEGHDVNKTSRKIVSIEEQYQFAVNMIRQIGLKKKEF
jgi:hypothetical protein